MFCSRMYLTLQYNFLEVTGRGHLLYLLASGSGTRKAHQADIHVARECGTGRGAMAIEDVDDTRRKAHLVS